MKVRKMLQISICLCAAAGFMFVQGRLQAKDEPAKKLTLEYIGVQTVVITAPDGTRLVCDPYSFRPEGMPEFPKNIKADAVAITHFHSCHSNVKALIGKPKLFYDPGEYSAGMIKMTAYKSEHGILQGKPTGENCIFVFNVAGAKIVHMGAAGVVTDAAAAAAVKGADIVIVNALGGVTKPQKDVIAQMKSLGVRTVIPAHYSLAPDKRWEGGCTLDEFVEASAGIYPVQKTGSLIEVTPGMPVQVLVMKEKVLSGKR